MIRASLRVTIGILDVDIEDKDIRLRTARDSEIDILRAPFLDLRDGSCVTARDSEIDILRAPFLDLRDGSCGLMLPALGAFFPMQGK